MTEPMSSLKPGDRVRKLDGTTATVATAPRYYEREQGHPFTGWAVVIEPAENPERLRPFLWPTRPWRS
jgi:hypothetical protein